MAVEVYALVGPAGTGKSHRANITAHEYDIPAIIDDGLLIEGTRIVAGTSAKGEETRIAAVRRAIFSHPEHRDEVRRAIEELNPERLLVLGTSDEMIFRICDNLGLPRPLRTVRIEEIATPDEIRQARRIRRQQGKHVVPAPTVEVKRGLSGKLIDPLRYFARSRAGEDLVVDKSTVRPTFSSLGRFLIEENALRAIAAAAAMEAGGVAGVLKVRVKSRPRGIRLELELAMGAHRPMEPILRRVQGRVRTVLEHMTALNVLAVDVVVKKLELEEGAEAGAIFADAAGPPAPGLLTSE